MCIYYTCVIIYYKCVSVKVSHLVSNDEVGSFCYTKTAWDIIGMGDSITSTIHMGKGCYKSPP